MTDISTLKNAKKSWRPTWRTLALWFVLWLPWLYVGVFAYTDYPTWPSLLYHREFGWPYPRMELKQNTNATSQNPYYEVRYNSIAMLAVDLVLSLVIASVLFFVLTRWWRSFRARGFRFRVSTLLLLMVAISLPLAGWRYVSDAYERELALMEEVKPLGITAFGDYRGPLLFRRLERFLPSSLINIWWRCYGTGLDMDAFAEGQAALVRDLERFSHLELLSFESCPPHHVAILSALPNVTEVELSSMSLDDESLKLLHSFETLKKIEFIECEVSAEAIEQLRKALPDAEIIYDGEETSE